MFSIDLKVINVIVNTNDCLVVVIPSNLETKSNKSVKMSPKITVSRDLIDSGPNHGKKTDLVFKIMVLSSLIKQHNLPAK
jgi:hypothetical protein